MMMLPTDACHQYNVHLMSSRNSKDDSSSDVYRFDKTAIDASDNVSTSSFSLISQTKKNEIAESINIPTRLLNVDVVIQKQVDLDDRQELGRDYVVKLQDVISGNFAGYCQPKTYVHPGNRRLLVVMEMFRFKYVKAPNRSAKSNIIRHVVDVIRESGGRFLKRDSTTGIWYDIGNNSARYKVRMLFRQSRMKRFQTSSPLDALFKVNHNDNSFIMQHDSHDESYVNDEESSSTLSDHIPIEAEHHHRENLSELMQGSNYHALYETNISIINEDSLRRINVKDMELRMLQNQLNLEQSLLKQLPSLSMKNISRNHIVHDDSRMQCHDDELPMIEPIDIEDSSSILWDNEMELEDFINIFDTTP